MIDKTKEYMLADALPSVPSGRGDAGAQLYMLASAPKPRPWLLQVLRLPMYPLLLVLMLVAMLGWCAMLYVKLVVELVRLTVELVKRRWPGR
jgi:hypothetical protein